MRNKRKSRQMKTGKIKTTLQMCKNKHTENIEKNTKWNKHGSGKTGY